MIHSEILTNAGVFNFRIDYDNDCQTYMGTNSHKESFSVYFGQYGTQVTLYDTGDQHWITIEFESIVRKEARLDLGSLYYIPCDNALFFSGHKKNKLVEILKANFGSNLRRITYTTRATMSKQEWYCAA